MCRTMLVGGNSGADHKNTNSETHNMLNSKRVKFGKQITGQFGQMSKIDGGARTLGKREVRNVVKGAESKNRRPEISITKRDENSTVAVVKKGQGAPGRGCGEEKEEAVDKGEKAPVPKKPWVGVNGTKTRKGNTTESQNP